MEGEFDFCYSYSSKMHTNVNWAQISKPQVQVCDVTFPQPEVHERDCQLVRLQMERLQLQRGIVDAQWEAQVRRVNDLRVLAETARIPLGL